VFPIFGIVTLGVLMALATDVVLSQLTPVKVAFILGGFALLIPTVVTKHPKAYWLFLLVVSIPFDISKLLSTWLVDPQSLIDLYAQPASGTIAIDLYLTDLVLVVMVLPWLARVAMRRETVYFPAIGYLFVLYLVWTLLVSLINAQSYYLALFELWRQALYFLLFVYLINNMKTRLELRSVIWAVFVGFIISASTVVAFFYLGYGTKASIFSSLKDEPAISESGFKPGKPTQFNGGASLTLDNERGLKVPESAIKRSQGMFRHPAIAASVCGLILPIVLAYLVAARRNRDRILFFMVFILGVAGLILTFSRAGAIGFAVGTVAFFAIGSWSGLISRRVLIVGFFALTVAVALSMPLLLIYFGARLETFYMRFNMFQVALQGYLQHPILGVGLNNSTGAMSAGKQEMRDMGIPISVAEAAPSYYLAVLAEVGPVGFILLFGFFGKIVMIALRAMREVAIDLKPLLVGIVAGLASLATQSLGDVPIAGHAVGGSLWLFAALIVAIARDVQIEPRPFVSGWPPATAWRRSH
jgi:O-antigen ligase